VLTAASEVFLKSDPTGDSTQISASSHLQMRSYEPFCAVALQFQQSSTQNSSSIPNLEQLLGELADMAEDEQPDLGRLNRLPPDVLRMIQDRLDGCA
jgi:transglutaminase/protease-like cytokinesis protein 3